MKSAWKAAVYVFITIWVVPSKAQNYDPQQVLAAIRRASPTQRDVLSKRFGFQDAWRNYTCQELDPELLQTSQPDVSIVLVRSSDCQLSFLTTFWRENKSWLYGGSIALNNQEGLSPSISVLPLISNEHSAIIVKGNIVASGTGLSQRNLQIFMLVDGTSKLVLNEPSKVFFRTQLPGGGSYIQSQESIFSFAPPQSQVGVALVQEVMHSSANGRSLTEHYQYIWDPRLKILMRHPDSPN